MFPQTQELSKEDEVTPPKVPDSEVQREEEEFEDQIRMHLKKLNVHQKNCLKFLLPKRDLPGTKKWYKKLRSIKLLSGLPEKA